MNYLSRAPFNIGRRNMFWEPARGPHAARLGQAVYQDPSNRLLEQALASILARRLMLSKAPDTIYQAGFPGKIDVSVNPGWVNTAEEAAGWASGVNEAKGQLLANSPLPPQATQAFFEISQAPTSQELDDSKEIDAFFGPTGTGTNRWATQICVDGYFYTGVDYSGDFNYAAAMRDPNSPYHDRRKLGEQVQVKGGFWCSPWAEGKLGDDVPGPVRYAWDAPSPNGIPGESIRAHFYGLNLNEPWGAVKPWFKNALLADYVLSKYPFPAPFGEYTRFWSYFALPGFRDLVRSKADLAEEDIRVWITFSVITHYNEMVDSLNGYLKAQARSEHQDMIAKVIAVAAMALIAGIFLAPEIASIVAGIANSAVSAMNKIDAHKLQEDMAKIQDAFKTTDPAFAGQVGEASAYVQRLSAALETAVDKSTVQRTLASTSLSTGLMIGGGLAAIGALALALFRK